MKKLVSLSFILLCFVSHINAQKSENVIIEDFEDGNSINNLGGYWYSFNDNPNGGRSRISQEKDWKKECFVTSEGYNSKGLFTADVRLDKGTYQWNPYYAFATMVSKSSTVNPSTFAGISYWHKGVAHTFRVDIQEVTDYDNHQVKISAHDDWTLVTIDYSMLNQSGWGKRVDFNVDNDIKLVWNLEARSGRFQIDNVQFEKHIEYEKQNDMEILPVQIPPANALKGNVDSPLNDLSKKYLTKGMNLASWAEANKITTTNPKEWKYNEEIIKLQAKQGLLGIRFPIDLDLYVIDRVNVLNGTNPNIEIEPMLYTLLDSMNVWTKRYGLSYTVDYHAYDGSYSRTASKDPKFRAAVSSLWRVVAEHFENEKRPDLFFELTNEPGLSLPEGEFIDQADWNILAQSMVDSIRKVDQTTPIIFGDTKWYSLDELIKNKPLKDDLIIYCFHMYDPFVFTHQGASWTNMGSMKGIPFPYSEERWSTEYRDFGITDAVPEWVKQQMKNYYKEGNKQHIKNRLAKVKNWAYDHKVPLICNEWGALPNTAKIDDLNAYFKTMGEIFREMDISWQVWFGIMDADFRLLPGMAEALDLKVKE